MHTGIETKHFPSWEAFMTWKEAEEESSFTYFVQPNGGKTKNSNSSGTYMYLHVHVYDLVILTSQYARACYMCAVVMENNVRTCSHERQVKREIILGVLGNYSNHIVWQECTSSIFLNLNHQLLKSHTFQLIPIILLELRDAGIFLYLHQFIKKSEKSFLRA